MEANINRITYHINQGWQFDSDEENLFVKRYVDCPRCGSKIRYMTKDNRHKAICFFCGFMRFMPSYQNFNSRSSSLAHWSKQVIGRDGRCVICESKENLEAHHLIFVSTDESQKMNYGNGITLCRKCHKKVHNQYN